MDQCSSSGVVRRHDAATLFVRVGVRVCRDLRSRIPIPLEASPEPFVRKVPKQAQKLFKNKNSFVPLKCEHVHQEF